jgi:hypothetical protein
MDIHINRNFITLPLEYPLTVNMYASLKNLTKEKLSGKKPWLREKEYNTYSLPPMAISQNISDSPQSNTMN